MSTYRIATHEPRIRISSLPMAACHVGRRRRDEEPNVDLTSLVSYYSNGASEMQLSTGVSEDFTRGHLVFELL